MNTPIGHIPFLLHISHNLKCCLYIPAKNVMVSYFSEKNFEFERHHPTCLKYTGLKALPSKCQSDLGSLQVQVSWHCTQIRDLTSCPSLYLCSPIWPNAHPCVTCEPWVSQVLGSTSPKVLQSAGLHDQLAVHQLVPD